MQYFFSTEFLDDNIILSKEESTHCVIVLRHNIGDIIYIVDGEGNRFSCKIINIDGGIVKSEIIKKENLSNDSNHYIHIIISPTKSSQRFEWFVEKAVEIGIDEISFVKCSNSERKKININRVRKVALTAMKQSLKASMPKINDINDFNKIIGNIFQECKYIGYQGDISSNFLSHIAPKNNNYCLLIGPEGDFTNEEVDSCLAEGFTPVLLNKSRLRTETAAIAGCLALNQINYDK